MFQRKKATCKRNKWINFFSLFEVYLNKFQRRALCIKCDNLIIINTLNNAMKKLIKNIISCWIDTWCKRSRIIVVAMYKRNNHYTRRFIFFDDVCVTTFIHWIIALIFKHALNLFLTVIDHIYNFSSIISFYIIFLFCF